MSLVGALPARALPIERLDPRIRIVCACAFVLAALAMNKIPTQIAMVLAGLGLAFLADLKPRELMHRLLHVESFMLVLLILLPLTTEGRSLAAWGPFSLSENGLARAIAIALKVNAAVIATMALLATLEPVRLGRGLSALGMPARLIHLLLFVVRYQMLFREEGARLREAMRARGFVPRLRLHTWRAYGNFVGMVLVRSMERAERVEEAMRCRGFSGRFPLRGTRALQRIDFAFIAALGLFLATALLLDRFA